MTGTDEGVEGNARMTAVLGVVLLVAFAAEGVTVLSVNQLFTWHVFIGLFIVPIVCMKVATTGYRFYNYYRGTPAYARKGAPHPVLRITSPLLIVATVLLLVAGIVALAVGPRHADTAITIHQGAAIAWATLVAVHLVGHAIETWKMTTSEVRGRPAVPRRRARVTTMVIGLLVGVTLGIASLNWTDAWRVRGR